MPLVSCDLQWEATYHAWCMSCSFVWVHSWAVSGSKAAPCLGKAMSAFRNLERITAQTLGRDKDCEKRAMLESRRCQLFGRVWQRYFTNYVFQDIVNDLKLTFIKQRMLAVMIMRTPGRRNNFVDWQKAEVRIAVQPIMDMNTPWNSTLELLVHAYQMWDYTCEWLKNPKYSECLPLCPTQHEWTIIKYVMEVLKPFQYWTLWMSKTYSYSALCHHCLQWHVFSHEWCYANFGQEEDTMEGRLILCREGCPPDAVQIVCRSHSTTGLLPISVYILDLFRKLGSLRKWDKVMDTNSEDKTFCTTQYQEAILKYIENEYCAQHWRLSVI